MTTVDTAPPGKVSGVYIQFAEPSMVEKREIFQPVWEKNKLERGGKEGKKIKKRGKGEGESAEKMGQTGKMRIHDGKRREKV